MVLTFSVLRHLALCCLQTNVLFHWSREPVLCSVFPCIMKCLVMKEWLVTFWQCVYFWGATLSAALKWYFREQFIYCIGNCLVFKAMACVWLYLDLQIWIQMPVIKKINVNDCPVLHRITPYEYQFRFHDMFFTLSNLFQ